VSPDMIRFHGAVYPMLSAGVQIDWSFADFFAILKLLPL
jgi:hypothetical protein